jgi:heptosyltransferase-2
LTAAKRAGTILVFRSAALGDFVLACPAFRLLRQTYPNTRIVLLTMQSSNKVIRASVAMYSPNSPVPWVNLAVPHLIDDVVLFNSSLSLASLRALRAALAPLHVERAALFLDPAASWPGRLKKLLLIRLLCGWIPVMGWRARGSLKGNRPALKAAGLLPHHVHGSTHFLRELTPPRSYTDEDIVFDLREASEDAKWAAGLIEQQGWAGLRIIAVAPGSIQPHKRWPTEKFIELCRQLALDDPRATLLIVGTPADAAIAAAMREALGPHVADLTGKTSVGQLASLLKRCTLLVGNDGGAMHLGDAMGCKVVSIVPGIEFPDSIEPWNNRQFAVRHPVACAPCYSFMQCPLGHNKCMTELPVSSVLGNCRRQLQR